VWSAPTVTASNVASLTDAIRIGVNSAGAQFFDGRVYEVAHADMALSESTLGTDVVSYSQATYGTP
jgi:hypothetical protein